MKYPKPPALGALSEEIRHYGHLKTECGARGVGAAYAEAERAVKRAIRKLKGLREDRALAKREPDDLEGIQALRPAGPRRMWDRVDKEAYPDKIRGALLARMAGCTLGAIVEGRPVEWMEERARICKQAFPPTDYWTLAERPDHVRYGMSRCDEYTRSKMNGAPVDDDIAYTLLGLLIAEKYGPDFTLDELGKAWLKWLPMACTAEKVALDNLRAGIPAEKAAEIDNPYTQWIGGDIRADPWGYIAPGWPEKAAEMAYRDAYLTHRRNGIYGTMFFAAAIAASFAVDDPIEAIRIGLTEIPRDCLLAREVRWALREGKKIHNYREARAAVDARFPGMHPVHTINNACLTIFGLMIGGKDVTKVLGETVAMGLDNDCTAATAGSIVGAVVGGDRIPKHWHKPFNNIVHSYLIGLPKFRIDDLLRRFARQAALVHRQS